MSWFESSPNAAQSEADHYFPFYAGDFDFPSGHVRLWTGAGPLVIGADTYLGGGELVKIKPLIERAALSAERMEFELSGVQVNPGLVSESDIEACFGRAVILYLGFLNNTTHQLIDTPEIAWEGEISNIGRTDGPLPAIRVNAEHRHVELQQTDDWRYTHEHQQEFFPGENDLGFNLIERTAIDEIIWGGRRVRIGRGVGGRTYIVEDV